MWTHDEVDLTPEPWHTPNVPGLDDASEDQTEYWNAPTGEEALKQTGLARWLGAMGWRYGQMSKQEQAICRPDAKGEPDDVVITGDTFRMERMDSGNWWIAVYRGDKRVCFGLSSKSRIRALVIEDEFGLRDA